MDEPNPRDPQVRAARIAAMWARCPNPATGEPYKDMEVEELTGGEVSHQNARLFRLGKNGNPSAKTIACLVDLFHEYGVSAGYIVGTEADGPDDRVAPLLQELAAARLVARTLTERAAVGQETLAEMARLAAEIDAGYGGRNAR